MVMTDAQVNNPTENLYYFSAFIGEEFQVSETMLCNHIFGTISVALSVNIACRMDVSAIYDENSSYYYNVAAESGCMEHSTITQCSIETEIHACKALGILLSAENNPALRQRVIHILKQQYSHIYKTVKKHNFKYLNDKYVSIQQFLQTTQAKFDRAVYFYLSFYCSPDWVEQSLLNSIVQSIYDYECHSPIRADIKKELIQETNIINKLRRETEVIYGSLENYLDVNEHSDFKIRVIGNIIENLFHINKLNMDDIYFNHRNSSPDEIYLAIAKQSDIQASSGNYIFAMISCLYLQPLLKEYQAAREYIRNSHTEARINDLLIVKKNLQSKEEQIKQLTDENSTLKEQKKQSSEYLSQTVNQLNKKHAAELAELNHTIRDLTVQLQQESTYRQELNKLREYIFNLDLPLSLPKEGDPPLIELISDKHIVIIGGTRPWRQKLRAAFPMINTLNGSNSSLDLSIFKKIDCVLFLTSYMSHTVYNKAMNYIRSNHIKFGYIKATNIQLLEAELIDVLKQCDVIWQ